MEIKNRIPTVVFTAEEEKAIRTVAQIIDDINDEIYIDDYDNRIMVENNSCICELADILSGEEDFNVEITRESVNSCRFCPKNNNTIYVIERIGSRTIAGQFRDHAEAERVLKKSFNNYEYEIVTYTR